MSLFSLAFIFLFCAVCLLYFALPHRFRWLVLLAASLVYAFVPNAQFLAILLSIVVDFLIARRITLAQNPNTRKWLLLFALIHNIAFLVVIKYLVWLNANPLVSLIGVSFFVIIKIGYVVDVYSRRIQAVQNLGVFAAFSLFFLTLSSGPIERAGHLIPQLQTGQNFDRSRFVLGSRRVLIGLFKKMIIADNLSVLVDAVYNHPENFGGALIVFATITYAFQLYADFSGYTDIVLGLGKILGFDLFENFRQPYFATSILDFWKRWHISLSNWIREFMFFPLTRFLLGKKLQIPQAWIQAFVYCTVMGVVGLWHGSTVNFLVWGGLHGLYMTLEMLLPASLRTTPANRLSAVIRSLVTFSLVCFAWVWFRANTLPDAWYLVTHVFKPVNWPQELTALPAYSLWFALAAIGLMLLVDWVESSRKLENLADRLPLFLRWAAYYALFIPVFLALFTHPVIKDFVYFRF